MVAVHPVSPSDHSYSWRNRTLGIAMNVRNDLKPLKKPEIEAIKEKAMAGVPLFRYNAV
jgi:hypothetical protein